MKIATAIGTSAVLAVATATTAQAQGRSVMETTGPYVGFGYNFLDFDSDFGGDSSLDALQLRLGWQFDDFWSAELDANFGVSDDDFSFESSEESLNLDDNNDGDLLDVVNSNGELELDYLFGAYLRGTWPATDALDVSARLGYAFAELDSEVTTANGNTFNAASGDDDGFAIGADVNWDMTEAWGLRFGYTHYEFDDVDASGLDLNVSYKF